jgi:anti-sigma B factor antagonist
MKQGEPGMDFQYEVVNDVLVFEILNKRATVEISGGVKNELLRQIDDGMNKVLVNLENAEYVDSSFLGILVAGLKRATMKDGDLKIMGLQPAVKSMFELTRLYRIFDIFDSKEEALKSF